MTAERWARALTHPRGIAAYLNADGELPEVIALANAALPDGDPRKITREWIATLRQPHADDCMMWALSDYAGAQQCNCGGDEKLYAIADVLASYLPPTEGA